MTSSLKSNAAISLRLAFVACMAMCALAVPAWANQIIVSDQFAQFQNFFRDNEDIYAFGDLDDPGSIFPPRAPSGRIYIVENNTVSFGSTLVDVSSDGFNQVAGVTGSGFFSEQLIWASPLKPGAYDIVLDEGRIGSLRGVFDTPDLLLNAGGAPEILVEATSNHAARLTTGSPISLSQTVNTPSDPFSLSFSIQFETATGELTVLLDGIPLGQFTPNGSSVNIAIDDSQLLGKNGIPLVFEFDGPTGSKVALDDVVGPQITNGGFQFGTHGWTVSGNGSVETVDAATIVIPVPATLPILVVAFGGVGLLRRKRRQN